MDTRVVFITTPSSSSSCLRIINSILAADIFPVEELSGGMVNIPITIVQSNILQNTKMVLYYETETSDVFGISECREKLGVEFRNCCEGRGKLLASVMQLNGSSNGKNSLIYNIIPGDFLTSRSDLFDLLLRHADLIVPVVSILGSGENHAAELGPRRKLGGILADAEIG
jgi:hypothetical protein